MVEHGRIRLPDLVPYDEMVATCPIIVHEVLRGTRNGQRYQAAREMLVTAMMLDGPTPLSRFEEAARLYLECRSAGVTPSSVDCLIAVCAIAHRVPLLHRDSDFTEIARVVSRLQIFSPS